MKLLELYGKKEEKYYISVVDVVSIVSESKNVEPIKLWLARLGIERIDEMLIRHQQFKER